jgi:hypothetical protein
MCSRCDQRAQYSIAYYATTLAMGVAFAHMGFYATCATVVIALPYLYVNHVIN